MGCTPAWGSSSCAAAVPIWFSRADRPKPQLGDRHLHELGGGIAAGSPTRSACLGRFGALCVILHDRAFRSEADCFQCGAQRLPLTPLLFPCRIIGQWVGGLRCRDRFGRALRRETDGLQRGAHGLPLASQLLPRGVIRQRVGSVEDGNRRLRESSRHGALLELIQLVRGREFLPFVSVRIELRRIEGPGERDVPVVFEDQEDARLVVTPLAHEAADQFPTRTVAFARR